MRLLKAQKRSISLLLLSLLGGIAILWLYGRLTSVKEEKKRIVLIHSFNKEDVGYGNFQKCLEKELKEREIVAEFDTFYLDCDAYDEPGEIVRIKNYLNTLNGKSIDLILAVNDPASYSLLKTEHPWMKKLPVILANVNFPNEDALKPYENDRVYTLRDTPDFKRNIEFIQTLHRKDNVRIFVNVDETFLGRRSFDVLRTTVDKSRFRFWGNEKGLLYEGRITSEIQRFIAKEKLMDTSDFDISEPTDSLTLNLMPFRYMRGLSMLIIMSQALDVESGCIYLLDKFDLATRPLSRLLNIPSFSCVREGFDEETKIVGGYMATDELSAQAVARLSKQLFLGKKNEPTIQDIEKEYVVDWKVLSNYSIYDVKSLPDEVRIINYPFTDKYRKELNYSGIIFILLFITIAINLILLRRRARRGRENEKYLQKIYDQLALSISGGNVSSWYIKKDMLEFDTNFTRLTGIKERHYAFDHFLKNLHPGDLERIQSILEQTRDLQKMVVERVRLNFDQKDTYRWFEIRCNSLNDALGEKIVAGIMQDVQGLVEREEELIMAKELAANAELKQSFLTNMSHEIRTPLNAIVGFTNLLLSEEADEFVVEEKTEMLRIVNRNNELLLKLINDVLDISRLDSNNLEFTIHEYDIFNLVKEIYRTHQVIIREPLAFHLELDEEMFVRVNTDKLRFTQVISNFLSNANKFTEEGSITLGCEIDKERKEVSIYVEDTGKGIDEEHQKMIFERFYKTDEFAQGTGLGLSISKVIMEKLSGRIELISKAGKGSRFVATLPYIEV